ncbi:hypothetical protein, partial [Perlabentimonas gracilis]|uniref:hypothetical protein n=1 Tax=Perlabentimonas gracilis TaxID=2715279 RepID=UPI001C63B434
FLLGANVSKNLYLSPPRGGQNMPLIIQTPAPTNWAAKVIILFAPASVFEKKIIFFLLSSPSLHPCFSCRENVFPKAAAKVIIFFF